MSRESHMVVLGHEPFNLEKLRRFPRTHPIAFEGLFRFDEVQSEGHYPLQELSQRAMAQLDVRSEPLDGIMGYWDFPVTSLVPLLCRRYGLPGPSLEAVLRCEHKYWSRLEQAKVIPEHTPRFCVFDPHVPSTVAAIDLAYPFWVKPIKSHSSQLGFCIRSRSDLQRCLPIIRKGISRFSEPFGHALTQARLPEEVAAVDGRHCIAEEMMGGHQCTAEGYVHRGEVQVYAIIDSIRHAHCSSFARYQYPSRLPATVQRRIAEVSAKIMSFLEYDQATFNIEYFWDSTSDKLWLLEINPRLSQSHADMTEKVDGIPNLENMVAIALGRRPLITPGQGRYRCAAKCFMRSFRDAFVNRVPRDSHVRAIEEEIPGASIHIVAQPGKRLSALQNQDSYSYELALIHIGADTEEELLDKYQRCKDALHFELSPATAIAAASAARP